MEGNYRINRDGKFRGQLYEKRACTFKARRVQANFDGISRNRTRSISMMTKTHKTNLWLISVAVIAFITLMYTYIETARCEEPPKRDFLSNLKEKTSPPPPKPQQRSPTTPTAVILFTQMRSGSSILGEVFNQKSDVSYFYEPLFPFRQLACDSDNQMRVEVLRQMTSCKFDELSDLYTKAFHLSKGDDFPKCVKKSICFSELDKGNKFLRRDSVLCESGKPCPTPINSTALSQHCRRSLLVAMKVIYLCKLERLLPLIDDSSVKLKIVHLVRDPRATANSRATTPGLKQYKGHAQNVCNKLSINAHFLDENQKKFGDNYIRIRHEDFAMDPVGTTRKIYDFVGINMPPSIESWLRETTSASNSDTLSKQNSQGTKRNARYVVSAWRKSRSFDEIVEVQKLCGYAMKKFGYKLFENRDQVLDIEGLSSF